MAYMLVALDMDGTLLNTAHETTPRTREALRRAAAAGRLVALSTGRCMSELRQYLADMPEIGYIIGENGAFIYDVARRKVIHRLTITDAEVARVFAAGQDLEAVRQCFIDGQSYIQTTADEALRRSHIDGFAGVFRSCSRVEPDLAGLCRAHAGDVSKVNLYFAGGASRRAFLNRIRGGRVGLSDSIGIGVEISPREATKASGLQVLCAYLGIPVEQAMAVGDGGNDLEIMGAAGFSVAMGNAIDAVRALAHAVTADCDHDGAALAIERYML